MNRTLAFALGPVLAFAACSLSSSKNLGPVGSVRASIKVVPPKVNCVQIVAAGTQTIISNFDVVPGRGSVLTINNLPIGNTAFTGFAFDVACANVDLDDPTWASSTSQAAVAPGKLTELAMTLEPVGGAVIDVNFDTDGGVAPRDLAEAPDLATTCLPANSPCTSSAQCCTGTCFIGLCF